MAKTESKKSTPAREIYKKIGEKLQEYYRDLSPMDWYLVDIQERQEHLTQEILILLNKLYYASSNDNFYWMDCPLSVFENTIEERLKDKKEKFLDPDLSVDRMFLNEYKQLNNIATVLGYKHFSDVHRHLGAVNPTLNDFRSFGYQHIIDKELSTKEKLEGARLDKIKFIENYFKQRGEHIIFRDGKYYLDQITNQETDFDLSDTKSTEKIIYLHELGILDFLEKNGFNYSKNSLATVISAFTGIKQETAQSYLNPINNSSSIQKNNPLNRKKNVEKIRKKLNDLGFNPNK